MSSVGGDGILTVTGWARFEKLHAEYNKLQQTVTKLEAANKKITSESKRTEQAQQSTFGAWGLNVTRMIASYASLHTALQLITKELETQKRLQEGARRTDISLADAQNALFGALGAKASDPEASAANQRALALSRTANIPLPMATLALSQTIGATLGANYAERVSLSERAIRASIPFFRSPEKLPELGQFAGAALDIQKGVPGLTPEQSVQILNAAYSQSRATDVVNLKNMVPAAVSAQVAFPGADQYRNSLQALSLAAAMSSRIGDPTLEKSATALSNLPEVLLKYGGDLVSKDKTLFENMQAVAAVPEVAELVKTKLKGRGPTKGPQREFIDQMLSWQYATEVLPTLEISEAEATRLNRRLLYGTPELQRATAAREYQASEQERLRKRYATAGYVRALLFGGEIGEQQIMGGLTEGSQQFKAFGSASLSAAQIIYDIAVRGGMDPREAGRRAIRVVEEGSRRTTQSTAFYDMLEETIQGLPSESENTKVMEELKQQRKAAEQQAVTTQNALQGANAAAQGRNQQE